MFVLHRRWFGMNRRNQAYRARTHILAGGIRRRSQVGHSWGAGGHRRIPDGRAQYAPPRSPNPSRTQDDEDMTEALKSIRGRGDAVTYEPAEAMRKHFAMISNLIDHPSKVEEEVS